MGRGTARGRLDRRGAGEVSDGIKIYDDDSETFNVGYEVHRLNNQIGDLISMVNGLCVALAGSGLSSPVGPALDGLAGSVSELTEQLRESGVR
jgi:hypothetical protein